MKNEGPQDELWPLPYERPNQKWLCGREDAVFPCPLGPDSRGRCRTTAECSPALEKKDNDEKGRYRCTRRPEYGGPCADGPLPSGACSHPRPPCAPLRGLRSRRLLFSCWILGVTLASLLLLFHGDIRYRFANPGPLSSAHAQPKGGQLQYNRVERENCAACHRIAGAGMREWVEKAAGADPHPLQFAAFLRPAAQAPTRMDATCAGCHGGHQFHHVNMNQEQSCLKCHHEHQGDKGLLVKTSQQCISCHGNLQRMAEASGGAAPADARPRTAITRFSREHPEFHPIAAKLADPNTLRFNHQKHLSLPISGPDGKPLQCAACHQEDAAGEYHQRIRFAQNCQSCHALQFDPETPELQLPHGDVEFVRAFLNSLPQQYEKYGEKVRGITESRSLRTFVDAQMARLQERQVTGARLEEGVFFSRSRRLEPSGNTVPFYGCAYCHEVTGSGNAIQVVRADVPVRWLAKGAFGHRAHQMVSCTTCHNAPQSRQTSDILLPSVKVCAGCHQSSAAPGESCTLCHTYHRWRDQLFSAQ